MVCSSFAHSDKWIHSGPLGTNATFGYLWTNYTRPKPSLLYPVHLCVRAYIYIHSYVCKNILRYIIKNDAERIKFYLNLIVVPQRANSDTILIINLSYGYKEIILISHTFHEAVSFFCFSVIFVLLGWTKTLIHGETVDNATLIFFPSTVLSCCLFKVIISVRAENPTSQTQCQKW